MEFEKRDYTTVGSAWSVLVSRHSFVILTCLQFVSEFPLWADAFVDKTLTDVRCAVIFLTGAWRDFEVQIYLGFGYFGHVQLLTPTWMDYNQYNISYF